MRFIAILGLLAGCESMPPSGNPLAPAKVEKAEVATPASESGPSDDAPEPPTDGFDFDADAGKGEPEPELIDDPIALLAAQQGIEVPPTPPEPEPPPPAPTPAPQAAPATPAPAAVMAPISWTPETAAPVDWGVRLVSTLNDTSPPRAVLGLPDGSEQVVTAGTFLPAQQLVVMAVGDRVVEVAHISNAGYQAKVETRMVQALFE